MNKKFATFKDQEMSSLKLSISDLKAEVENETESSVKEIVKFKCID